eukprot:CAMPEP_0202053734 /NCGR_PEP_ID=MMETSP0963-20130614/6024_1 /ASSEMBLY_ACC=CAM_ASM_000494 /TAXON_ID=4773 /ORGANISM="Schizochytrium aggregatum, Strain ATCC28209" /LENGTH=214 /DNA_ID=CAMNT_0048619095 /DNA_START=13 /DNA_END=657 /DNA_ORIENTATION=+
MGRSAGRQRWPGGSRAGQRRRSTARGGAAARGSRAARGGFRPRQSGGAMPRVDKCYFCSGPCYPGHGITFVRNDSKVFRFCRSKCHVSFKLKRNPRKTKWTKAYRKCRAKEMMVDSTFDFEKRRNRPIKYDRELLGQTLHAMKRVAEIRSDREGRYYRSRMRNVKQLEKVRARKEIVESIDLVAPAASKQRKTTNVAERAKAKLDARKSAAMED